MSFIRGLLTKIVAPDQSKLFNAAKKLLGMKDRLSFPDHLDKYILANDISSFFIQKVDQIRNILICQSDHDLVPPDTPILESQQLHLFLVKAKLTTY